MKTVAVCGDSWFTSDNSHPGKSFGEIIARNNNWNLKSLAQMSCSNFAISLQVDRAIELKSDFIIVGTTTPDRVEIPIIDSNNKYIWENLKSFFNWSDWADHQPEVYKKSHGVDNIRPRDAHGPLAHDAGKPAPTVISESINNLLFRNRHNFDNLQLDALKLYATALYDSGVKRQVDCWIISDACRRLISSKIPFLLYIEPLFDPGDHWQTGFKNDIDWVDKKNIIEPWQFSYYNLPQNNAGAFHYNIDQGAIVFATYIESRIKELL
jgi:hypothetical protein